MAATIESASGLGTDTVARLGVAPDLVALAVLIYGPEGSTCLSELTVADIVDYARDLLALADEDNDCLWRGLPLVWLMQDTQAIYETKIA